MIKSSEGIEIGKHHWVVELGGFEFNGDTIVATWIAGAIVLLLGFWLRAVVTSGPNPGKLQLFWEAIVNWINGLVRDNMGYLHPVVAPLAISLFLFILIANMIHFLPTNHQIVAAAADTNLTYAMAFTVIVGVHIFAVRHHGLKTYLKGYAQPHWAMTPLTIIEELVKPFTLALRLFGNIFAGGVMIALIGMLSGAFGSYELVAGNAVEMLIGMVWKLFDMFIGGIQAFIFALLTVLYFGMAAAGHGGHDEDDHASHDTEGELAHA